MVRRLMGFSLAVAGVLALAVVVQAQEKPKYGDKAKPGDKPAPGQMDDEMMKAFEQAGAVNENHALLKPMEGSWKAMCKMWMGPGEPTISEGTAVKKLIYGGRFLHGTHKSTMMGQPFEGMEIFGYDNMKKQFFATWIDSMSTSIYVSTGSYDPASKTFTMSGEYECPIIGGTKKSRNVVKIDSPTQHTFQMFESVGGGPETKNLEIVYTKQ